MRVSYSFGRQPWQPLERDEVRSRKVVGDPGAVADATDLEPRFAIGGVARRWIELSEQCGNVVGGAVCMLKFGPAGRIEREGICQNRRMTTLSELVRSAATLDPVATIFAERPWSEDSRAILVGEAVDDVREERQGMAYFLEVGLAQEVLEVWSAWRNGTTPTPAESVAAVVHYAEHDAYLPVASDDARDDAQ